MTLFKLLYEIKNFNINRKQTLKRKSINKKNKKMKRKKKRRKKKRTKEKKEENFSKNNYKEDDKTKKRDNPPKRVENNNISQKNSLDSNERMQIKSLTINNLILNKNPLMHETGKNLVKIETNKRLLKKRYSSIKKNTIFKKESNIAFPNSPLYDKLNNDNKQQVDSKNLNDQELNSLEYTLAIDLDKRTYILYYCSLLKKKHLLLFAFVPNNDYNLMPLKISFFLISFSLYFTVNGFFY